MRTRACSPDSGAYGILGYLSKTRHSKGWLVGKAWATHARHGRKVLAQLMHTLVLACLLLALSACGGGSEGATEAEAKTAKPAPAAAAASEATGASYKMPDEVEVPELTEMGGAPDIDTSGVIDGWVAAQAASGSRLKFQVACGEMAYNYDLPSDGTPVLFPLNMGNGSYLFRIMENIEGSSYAELYSTTAEVKLSDQFAPFLTPNIFCSYTASSACVKKARELVKGDDNEGQVVRDVCTFVAENVSYDFDKAKKLASSSGYIPDADETLKTKKGICFDYACLSAAMLRSLGLPAQVVTGYVSPDDLYHAWNMVYIDGTWQTVHFSVKPNTWSRCDVTFASAGSGSTIGDGTKYTDRFYY